MDTEEMELFIIWLDMQSIEKCVYPEGQNFDCEDCSQCRETFFNRVRNEFRERSDFL